MSTPSFDYARRAADSFSAPERTILGLYTPVATKALQLGVVVRESNEESQVLTISSALLRHLLAPGVLAGANAPRLDYARLDRAWEKASLKGLYLGALRELQLLAASYVSNATTLGADPATRQEKLDRMGREAHEMIGYLAIIVGHHGYKLSHIAAYDLPVSESQTLAA